MKFLVGNWKGIGEGEPGKGDYERIYEFVLNKNFIEVKKQIYLRGYKYASKRRST